MQQPLLRAHPERTAWFVVWCAFITFCVLVVAVPLGARYVLHYATAVRPARLEVLEGTARLTNPATGRLDAYTKDDKSVDVGEGIVIQLDDKSQVDLRFFDGSYVRIYGPSDLAVERLRAPAVAAAPVVADHAVPGGSIHVEAAQVGPPHRVVVGIRDIQGAAEQRHALRIAQARVFIGAVDEARHAAAQEAQHVAVEVGDEGAVMARIGDEEPPARRVGQHKSQRNRGIKQKVQRNVQKSAQIGWLGQACHGTVKPIGQPVERNAEQGPVGQPQRDQGNGGEPDHRPGPGHLISPQAQSNQTHGDAFEGSLQGGVQKSVKHAFAANH